jgi:site-specific recombinase XerD
MIPAHQESTRARGWNEMRLETAIDQFIADRRLGSSHQKPLSISTQRRYKWSLDVFSDWVRSTQGRPSVVIFSVQLVRDYMAGREARDLSHNTLGLDCSALREFARWGKKKRYWPDVDLDEFPNIARPRGTPRALLPADRDAVMQLPLEGPEVVLRALLYYLGARLDEVLSIRLRDIRPPHVLPDGTTLMGRVQLWGKGRKERMVGIHPDLWAVLAPHIQAMKGRPLDCPVLHRGAGKPWSKDMVYYRVRRWAETAGVEPFTPHQLRHTFATDLLEAEDPVDIRVVQEILGHERLSTTEIYLRVTDKRKTDAVLRLPSFRKPPVQLEDSFGQGEGGYGPPAKPV